MTLGWTDAKRDQVVKDLPYHIREARPFTVITQTELPQHIYNSWGIDPGGKPPTRPYSTEPQNTIWRNFRARYDNPTFSIYDPFSMNQKAKEIYSQWLLSRDQTVCGVGSRNIFPKWLIKRVFDDVPEKWDSIGLEVVSQVYNSGELDVAQAAIKTVVDEMKGSEDSVWGSFITNRK